MVPAYVSDLLELEVGKLVADGRYKVILALESTKQFPYPAGYNTYVVQDTKDGNCKTLQTLSRDDSESGSTEIPSEIEHVLGNKRKSFVLSTYDTFWHEGFLCSIQDLRGPNIRSRMEEHAGESASWTRKIFHGILEALQSLHANGVVHGDIQDNSVVITYPKLELADVDHVVEFYRSPEPLPPEWLFPTFNTFGSGAYAIPDSCDFGVRLQNLRYASTTDTRSPKYCNGTCSPPELVWNGQVSSKTDMWKVGVLIAQVLCMADDLVDIIGGAASNQVNKLLETQRYLGPLPPAYSQHVGSSTANPPHSETLLEKIHEWRVGINELEPAKDLKEEMQKDVFCNESLELATDLLLGLLEYDPEKRLSAGQALSHKFFHQNQKADLT